jgi:small subunit ribosomal protein S1
LFGFDLEMSSQQNNHRKGEMLLMAIPKVKPDVVADDEEKMGVEVEVTPEDQIIDGEPMPAEETAALEAVGIDPGALSDEEQAVLGALDTPAARQSKKINGKAQQAAFTAAGQKVQPEGFVQEADRWEYLWFIHKRGRSIEACVEKITFPDNLKTAVWELDLGGVKGVCPLSETGLESQQLMFRYVGQMVRVKIAGLDKENHLAACSRRAAIADARERVFETLQPDQIIDVVVKAVLPAENDKPPRLVVDVGGGVLVEVPRGSATRRQAERLERLFRPGKQAKAKVIEVDRRTDKIRVSLAAVEADPWATYGCQRGDVVSARVVRQVRQQDGSLMLYLEVQPGLIGIASTLHGLRIGDSVLAKVNVYSPKEQKLRLDLWG